MKKFILLMAVLLSAVTFNVNAQTNYCGSSRFTDNWSIGVNGGVVTNIHDWNAPQGALVGLTLDKNITPIFGITFEGGVGLNNNANFACDKGIRGITTRHELLSCFNGTTIENMFAFADARVNLTNALLGYTGTPRTFEVEAVGGVGYGHTYATESASLWKGDDLLTKVGANINLNLGEAKAWTLSLRPAVVWNISGGQFNSHIGGAQLTAGLTYHFKTSNGTHHFVRPTLYDQDEIDRLNAEINALKNRAPKIVEKTVTVEKTVVANGTQKVWVAPFNFNSADLTEKGKAELDKIAQNTVVVIDAYASCEPKTDETYNLGLTEARAATVKAYLESRGVRVAEANFHGGDDNFGRVAIVSLQ